MAQEEERGSSLMKTTYPVVTERNNLGIFIPHVIESVFIEVQSHKSERPIIIWTMYKPNSPPKADLAKCI
jgi:hypothetical protein